MSKNIIFVTGYFGAPIREIAEKTAEREGCALLSLDEEIERADGRSILRICMLMGEHEYRNKEYEILSKLPEDDLVVYCGDGVLNDEMSRDIILTHRLVIAGADMSVDELWENAKKTKDPAHAFMHFGSEGSRKKAFEDLYSRQRALYDSIGL